MCLPWATTQGCPYVRHPFSINSIGWQPHPDCRYRDGDGSSLAKHIRAGSPRHNRCLRHLAYCTNTAIVYGITARCIYGHRLSGRRSRFRLPYLCRVKLRSLARTFTLRVKSHRTLHEKILLSSPKSANIKPLRGPHCTEMI